MQLSELIGFSEWYLNLFQELQPKYQELHRILKHNSQQQQKIPLEEGLNDLDNYLKEMNLSVLTDQQISILKMYAIDTLLGEAGHSFIDTTIRKSEFDPATATEEISEAIKQLVEAKTRTNGIVDAFKGLDMPTAEPEIGEGKTMVRIHFTEDASIKNISDLKRWSGIWSTIIRGVALSVNEAPEETQVVGAARGSIILEIAGTLELVGVLVAISKSISSVMMDILKVKISMEELRSNKLLNREVEAAFKKQINEIEVQGVKTNLEEIRAHLKIPLAPENEKGVKESIEKALEFYNKGGELDFVSPKQTDEDTNESRDSADFSLKISELKNLIEDQRALKRKLPQLTHQTSEKSEK